MAYNRGPLSSDDIEDFIWYHLCKAYNENEEKGVNFEKLFDKDDESVPSKADVNEAADYLAEQGHVEKRVGEGEFWIELTNFGTKKCESTDIGTTWSV